MAAHELFVAGQTWWLDAAAGPQLLSIARMVTGAFSALAAGAALQNALRNLELEDTWSASDCRRFKLINWLKVIGLVLCALYYFCAGVFELDRTSSPHRLLCGNAAMSIMFLASLLDSLYWRNHYRRKRLMKGRP